MKITTNHKRKLISALLILIGLIFVFEILRDAKRAGDFVGYINAGNAVLDGQNIYNDPLNTWPPFFAVFSVPLSLADGCSPYWLRILWLIGMLITFYGVIQVSVKVFLKRKFHLFKGDLTLYHAIILIPFLLSFRYILDNLSNLQINIHMLWMSLICIYFFIHKKFRWAGFWLALSISLKVYTIFLLFYFIYKRAGKLITWTLVFLLIFNAIPFIVFGVDRALEYYQYWIEQIASPPPTTHHKNQSIMGALLRLLSNADTGMNATMNIVEMSPHWVKRFTYLLIGLLALVPAYFFRAKIKQRNSFKTLLEYAFILTAIPILSPLSWKAYFIFLWIPTLIIYVVLWHGHNGLNRKTALWLKGMFIGSTVLTVLSTEGIMGHHLSDILELYSCITIGTVLLLIILLILHQRMNKIELKN